jgi:hypothetical protein
MDVRDLQFGEASFDVVMDKGKELFLHIFFKCVSKQFINAGIFILGTMDAMLAVDSSPWVCMLTPLLHIFFKLFLRSLYQEPPQTAVENCTREVSEALR